MQVRVINAPGYEDFDGVLRMEVPRADGVPMSVVGYEWEGKRDFALFESRYVQEV